MPSSPSNAVGAGGEPGTLPPADANVPRRGRSLIALAGAFALLAIAAAIAVLVAVPGADAPVAPSDDRAREARRDFEAKKAILDQASRGVLKPSGPSAVPGSDVARQDDPADDARPGPEPPVVVRSASRPERREAPKAPSRAAAEAPVGSARTAAGDAGRPAGDPAPSPQAPVQVARAERWAAMRDEVARCSTSSLIPRIQCEQRIRARYCDGWEGTVPECPARR